MLLQICTIKRQIDEQDCSKQAKEKLQDRQQCSSLQTGVTVAKILIYYFNTVMLKLHHSLDKHI